MPDDGAEVARGQRGLRSGCRAQPGMGGWVQASQKAPSEPWRGAWREAKDARPRPVPSPLPSKHGAPSRRPTPRPDFSLKGRYKIAVGAGGSWLLVLCPWRACARTRVEGMRHPVRPSCRARRAAKEAKEAPAQPAPEKVKVEVKKFVKIGRPGYKGESGWGGSACSWPFPTTPPVFATDSALAFTGCPPGPHLPSWNLPSHGRGEHGVPFAPARLSWELVAVHTPGEDKQAGGGRPGVSPACARPMSRLLGLSERTRAARVREETPWGPVAERGLCVP